MTRSLLGFKERTTISLVFVDYGIGGILLASSAMFDKFDGAYSFLLRNTRNKFTRQVTNPLTRALGLDKLNLIEPILQDLMS